MFTFPEHSALATPDCKMYFFSEFEGTLEDLWKKEHVQTCMLMLRLLMLLFLLVSCFFFLWIFFGLFICFYAHFMLRFSVFCSKFRLRIFVVFQHLFAFSAHFLLIFCSFFFCVSLCFSARFSPLSSPPFSRYPRLYFGPKYIPVPHVDNWTTPHISFSYVMFWVYFSARIFTCVFLLLYQCKIPHDQWREMHMFRLPATPRCEMRHDLLSISGSAYSIFDWSIERRAQVIIYTRVLLRVVEYAVLKLLKMSRVLKAVLKWYSILKYFWESLLKFWVEYWTPYSIYSKFE